MSSCPICSRKTLRHIQHNRLYWYCPHCHQEVPDFSVMSLERQYSLSYQPSHSLSKALSLSI